MKKKAKSKAIVQSPTPAATPNIIQDALDFIAQQRTGGSINLRGVKFQLLYAVQLILSRLTIANPLATIRLEGIEDVDYYLDNNAEFIQVKTSINTMDAGSFWNLQVLQNFLKVYHNSPDVQFRLVHNTTFSKGHLSELAAGTLSKESFTYWSEKLDPQGEMLEGSLRKFLQRIFFETSTLSAMEKKILHSLTKNYQINNGAELPFARSLFYHVFEWSEHRTIINYKNVEQIIQSVRDAFGKIPVNPAAQHNWLIPIQFDNTSESQDFSYYDGKAARPMDIVRGLPVPRPRWQEDIRRSVFDYTITIIKSSSGQGKSTLAWITALQLVREQYNIYQIRVCRSHDEANAIYDFIETRLRIGESPVIIIDGLNQQHSHWAELAEMLIDKPVKILMTTREEDWIRYGNETTRLSLQHITIALSISEAADIFHGLKQRNKVHTNTLTWQPAWESIKEKGLLIEYVYLLTQGKMIEERLREQLSALNKERDSGAKMEILRIISLADVLHLRIRTSKLTDYILNTISLQSDRNELYRQLEKEYYLKFGELYVEGLHPVRSQHMVHLLHSHSDVKDSLLNLLKIIDSEYIYEFFIAAPLFHQLDSEFFQKASKWISDRSYEEMVYAIDGLMHYEPFNFWKRNQAIFDNVHTTGGLELFISDAIPFNHINTIENVAKSLVEIPAKINHLRNQLKLLASFEVKQTSVYSFVSYLGSELQRKSQTNSLQGVTFLYKWFKLLQISFPAITSIDESQLLQILANSPIEESAERFQFYAIAHPDDYKRFSTIHRQAIIGYIKRKTNTLSIDEIGEDIDIRYLLDKDANKANEQSVSRITIVQAFFPFYKHYCTKGIILPFPNEDTYWAVLQSSTKAIPPENLGDDFSVHVNQIWLKTLMDLYSVDSAYSWQQQHFSARKLMILLAKKCIRLLEYYLQTDESRAKVLIKEIVPMSIEYAGLNAIISPYPSNSLKYFEKKPFPQEQKAINTFKQSFINFINQLSDLLLPNKDSHLPLINIQTAARQLPAMQEAYQSILDATNTYFAIDGIVTDENATILRLANTARYYDHRIKTEDRETIVVPQRSVEQWIEKERVYRLEMLQTVLRNYEAESPFQLYLPNQILERDNLKQVYIGIRGFNMGNEEEIIDLSLGLAGLANLGIHYFTFLFVNSNREVTGGCQFSSNYFNQVEEFLKTEKFELTNMNKPIPVQPSAQMLETLTPGLLIKAIPASNWLVPYFELITRIWILSEHRLRLSPSSEVESRWLQEVEIESAIIIRSNLALFRKSKVTALPSDEMINNFLENKIGFTNEQLVQFLTDQTLIWNKQQML